MRKIKIKIPDIEIQEILYEVESLKADLRTKNIINFGLFVIIMLLIILLAISN